MILVTLGTQDKKFKRLLQAVERAITKLNITDDVIVQAGSTKYKSNKMKIYDYLSMDEMDNHIKSADLIITHAGVGTILKGLEYGKTMIVAPRLHQYKEHVNDHQVQILDTFEKEGYIIALRDFEKLPEIIKEAEDFKPKKVKSNNENFIKRFDEEIERLTKE